MMVKTITYILENTEIQKKCLGLTHIFFDQVCLKDHKIANMKKFDVFLGDKFRFLYKINEQKLTILEKELFFVFIQLILMSN